MFVNITSSCSNNAVKTMADFNGPSSLNDTNEICRLLHDLVESLKHVAKETDNTSFGDQRLLDIVENQDTLLDYQKGEIEFWEKQEASFVDTPVVNVISEIMESEHSVLIIGEPGIECPFETYQKEWDKLRVLDPYKYCSLFLCVIYNGIMKESLFDIYNENSAKNKLVWENIFEICVINRGTSKIKIKTILDSMIGTYVMKIGHKYRVIHDQMFDFMCCYFGNEDAMVRCILRYSDIRVFNQRTQLESINKQHGKFTIMISKKHEKEYFERIKCDLLLGNLNHCFYNTQMKYKKYRTSFVKILKSIDDKILITQMYQKPKNPSYDRHTDYSFETEGPLIKSCLRGYYDICQYFISKNIDLKKCDSKYTLLTATCDGGNEMIVQLLLDKGSDVNQMDDKGSDVNKVGIYHQTPLTAACEEGNEIIVQLLLDKGGDVNQMNWKEQTPLSVACSKENENIIQLLINKESDVNQADVYEKTPLTLACKGGNVKIVKLLIDKGSDVNKLLIDKGCDVNKVWRNSKTPLSAACIGGNKNIVQLLIDRGSDVNLVDANGSDVNQVNDKGNTALTMACKYRNEKIVQVLIDNRSLVNQVDDTPLTSACNGGNKKIVQLLLEKECDVNQIDGKGVTPLMAACSGTRFHIFGDRGSEKIVQLLLDEGSDINQPEEVRLTRFDDMKQTPLTAACSGGNEEDSTATLRQRKGG
ncbi:ANKRD17 [Mytilus edulis]|uniref:ANKRD17 n=1 Tax=Mytilus edulis TaxID=6550 RepID=A0A8S3SBB8_MYTED|nr:ANKRD17 [Mytilus edulis]